jgi:hypothetical protein
VAELADARDLKSLGPKDRTGSIPVFGTNYKKPTEKVGFLLSSTGIRTDVESQDGEDTESKLILKALLPS